MVSGSIQVGEGRAGAGDDVVRVNTVLGRRDGPIAAAWATALATPRDGFVAIPAIVQPGLPVQPPTLLVNQLAIDSPAQDRLVWGAAQAGVAGGVADAVADGVIPAHESNELMLIASVWIDPAALDDEAVYLNVRAATRMALEFGEQGLPHIEPILAARSTPWNPHFELLRG
jgi:5,6,7,8-tetrahydromethanopterin hydro-lyase